MLRGAAVKRTAASEGTKDRSKATPKGGSKSPAASPGVKTFKKTANDAQQELSAESHQGKPSVRYMQCRTFSPCHMHWLWHACNGSVSLTTSSVAADSMMVLSAA